MDVPITITAEQARAMTERKYTEADLIKHVQQAATDQLNYLVHDVKAEISADKTITQLKGI